MDKENIILIGAMGVGKSTIGKRLAKKLKSDFYDSDHVIEAKTGVDVATIFEYEGENGFREREEKVLRELCVLKNIILATGGGIILSANNRKILANAGVIFYLKASLDTILTRTKHENSRPLLNSSNKRKTISDLLSKRSPLYESIAHHIINTDHRTVNWSAEQIVKIINNK